MDGKEIVKSFIIYNNNSFKLVNTKHKMGKSINLDTMESVGSTQQPIGYLAFMLLSVHLRNSEGFRLTPKIREPPTLEELKSGFYFIEDDTLDESFLIDYEPSEGEFLKMWEKERQKGKRLEYALEFFKDHEETGSFPTPPTTLAPAIINRFRYMSQPDGKINVVYNGQKYEARVTISPSLTFDNKQLEELVVGTPELVTESRK